MHIMIKVCSTLLEMDTISYLGRNLFKKSIFFISHNRLEPSLHAPSASVCDVFNGLVSARIGKLDRKEPGNKAMHRIHKF